MAFEVSYPNGLVHRGGTVASSQKVIVRTGTSLTEWLDQWSYLLGIAPHTSPPTIVAKLVKDDGDPLDPSWHTENETSTWLDLNDSIKAVKAESFNTQGDGEVPGEDHRDINMVGDKQNMIWPTKKAKRDKYKGFSQKQRKQRRAQRETDALAPEISQAIDKMDIRHTLMTFPTTFSTTLSTRSNPLPEGLLSSRSCAGRSPSACSAPDKDMEAAEML